MEPDTFAPVENNINWLAQCLRRMRYPIDNSERVGLSAFEYGWKSFNSLYSKFNAKTDRQRMYDCLEKHLNHESFFVDNERDLHRFCEVDHKIYIADDNYNALNPKLSSQVQSLKEALNSKNYVTTPLRLVDCLYTVRNARIHGSFGTGRVYFSYLPKAIFLLNIFILCSKLGVTKRDLLDQIDKRSENLKTSLSLPA